MRQPKVRPLGFFPVPASPDMFPLVRQVPIATDQAKNGCRDWRVLGDPPSFEDNETTMGSSRRASQGRVDYLKTLDQRRISTHRPSARLRFRLGPNNRVTERRRLLNHFVLPNFYFHVTAAYAILRIVGWTLASATLLAAFP